MTEELMSPVWVEKCWPSLGTLGSWTIYLYFETILPWLIKKGALELVLGCSNPLWFFLGGVVRNKEPKRLRLQIELFPVLARSDQIDCVYQACNGFETRIALICFEKVFCCRFFPSR